ncbi:hypothetical protein HanRHA438_Chr13g0628551 [Helianthus annuus]|nr:hypothetical protein HanRHA438_Chr13g0628551 [Helianthus annuus]
MIHVVNQLGDAFKPFAAAIKAQDSPITYSELHEKLVDYESHLKQTETPTDVLTANYTRSSQVGFTQPNRPNDSSDLNTRSNQWSCNGPRNTHPNWSKNTASYNGNRTVRNNSYCQFCSLNGHDTNE